MPVIKKPILALDTKIVQDNVPFEVLPKLYIGSIHSSFNLEALNEYGITHILNCSRLPASFPKIFTYLSVDIRDKDDSNILACIPTSNIFIEAGMDCGGVLVHCVGGRSRSAALIAGYLMSSGDMSYDEALSLILSVRPVVSVNRGFEIQLRAYSKNCYDVYSAQQVLVRSRIKALNKLRGSKSAIESISANFENVRKSMIVLSPTRKGTTPTTSAPNSASSTRKLSETELRTIYNTASSNLPQATITKPINRNSFRDSNNSPIVLGSPICNDKTPSSITERKVFDNPSTNKRTWIDTNPIISSQSTDNEPVVESKNFSRLSMKHTVSELIPRESINELNRNNDDPKNSNLTRPLSFSKSKNNDDTSLFKSPPLVTLADISNDKLMSASTPDLFSSNNFNSNSTSSRGSFRLSSNASPQTLDHMDISPIFPKLVSKSSQTNVYQHQDDAMTNAILLHNGSINSRRNSFTLDNTTISPDLDSTASSNIPLIKERPVSITRNTNPIFSNNSPGKMISRPPSMSMYSQDTNDLEGQIDDKMPSISRNGSFHAFSSINITDKVTKNTSTKPPLGKSPNHNNGYHEMDAYNSDLINESKFDDNNIDSKDNNYVAIAKKKEKKDNIGYQSVIREFIPLFDSRSPHIRLSRPGNNTIRIIPPLRGLDRNYCCSWCGVGLFNLANVIRLDLDIHSDGFDILPRNSPSELATKGQIHIPTSTTNRASGLFQLQKQYSVDLSPASMAEMLSIGPPKGLPTPKTIVPLHSNDKTSAFVNLSSKFNNAGKEVENEDTFNMDYTANFTSSKSFVPKPPQSTRPKNFRAFDFDASPNDTNNTTQITSTSPMHKSITSNLTIRTTDSPVPNEFSPYNEINNNNNNNTSSPAHRLSIIRKISNYSSDESPRITIPPHRMSGSWTPSERPTSVEKRRWLSRVHLLNESMTDESRLIKLANDDDEAQRKAFLHNKYIYLEYLEWMGSECFEKDNDIGEIKCCNCLKVIGSWTWTPSERQSIEGKLDPPLFRIHKHVVQQSDFPLDATPLNTPRLKDIDSDVV